MNALRTALVLVLALVLASMFFSIAINSLSLGLCAVLWGVLMLGGKTWEVRRTPLDLVFLAYAAAELLAAAFSHDSAQAFLYAKRLLLIGLVYLLASVVRTERRARRLTAVFLGAAVLVACAGMVKLVVADPATTVRLGIAQFYMTTAGQMMMAGLLLVPFVLHPGTPRAIRIAAGLGAVPVFAALYATVTRGAYLAAAAGLLCIALVRYRVLVVPLLVLLVAMVALAPPYISDRIASIADPAHPENAGRLLLWETGLRILGDHPILGVGDIDLGETLRSYTTFTGEQWGHMHSMPMQFLVTLGIVGTLAAFAMFIRIARVEWRIYRRVRKDWFAGSLALGALAVSVGLQVNGLTEWSFGDQEVVLVFWTTVGLTLAAGETASPANDTESWQPSPSSP